MNAERLILEYITAGIRSVLDYGESEVFPAAAPDFDPNWKGPFICEVTPAAQSPYGPGDGSQDGGALLREQNIILWCFYRCQLDQYSKSIAIMLEENLGLLDRMEDIRKLFDVTALPTIAHPTPTDFVLIEPIRFVGMGNIEWEDIELKVVRRSLTLLVRYGAPETPVSHNLIAANYT